MNFNPLFVAALAGVSVLFLDSANARIVSPNMGLSPNEQSNLDAFLTVIAEGESDFDFFATAGGGSFDSTADHPALTGEFDGIPVGNGMRSYASGAFMITRDTWNELGGAARYGSFEPDAQVQAAIDLIQKRGAMPYVLAGDIARARLILADTWVIFKTSRWSESATLRAFQSYGGTLA